MTDPVVVILAPEDDVHARTVAWELERLGVEPLVLSAPTYLLSWSISHHSANDRSCFDVQTEDGRTIGHDQINGMWWRRPGDIMLPDGFEQEKIARFCQTEARALFEGWAYSLGRNCINPLANELAARRKPYQLAKAREAGFLLPPTLITSNPEQVLQFQSMQGDIIYKILSTTPWQFTETRKLFPEDEKHLSALRHAPVIFQKLIDGGPDIRVTVVDDQVFAVEMLADHSEAWLDWRLDAAVITRPHRLPEELTEKIVRYQRCLGLRYGALDFRIDQCGDYIFFEINPAGQYLFAEIHAEHPISRVLAKALLNGPPY